MIGENQERTYVRINICKLINFHLNWLQFQQLYVKQSKLNQSKGCCYENNLMFIYATALWYLTGGNLQESDWVCPSEQFLDPPSPPLINFVHE